MGRDTITVTISLFFCLPACAVDPVDDDGGEIEWSPDGGPTGDDVEGTGDLDDLEPLGMPHYQMPFHCGQVWRGNTFTGHNPLRAIDLNHDGGDFGRDVLAAARGTVWVVGDTGGDSYGKWIEIAHGDGHRTRYAHLSRRTVHVGQHVRKGQKIGEVGESGGASGPHLHFEERHNGVAISIRFNGNTVHYYGERRYTSHNCN
ncbi:MAG TPA: M23 family metallopeptidase [Kofleriaceae bacterium]|nr:M23 family metallopeptidase [Kofleriaceae bacterium]